MKPRSRGATRLVVRDLLARRAEVDDRVGSRCDIVGSMVGIKLRAGQALPRLGITYFVREKVALTELAPRERIPSRLKAAGQHVYTDVMVWPAMHTQALHDTRILNDGRTQGTMTAFAEASGALFGMSCGHCLLGADVNPLTPTVVHMDGSPGPTWQRVGTSLATHFLGGGALLHGSEGYVDCGLFSLEDATLRARALASRALTLADPLGLPGQPVYGVSTVKAHPGDDNQRRAVVLGVRGHVLNEWADVFLRAEAPGFFGGDSGTLWFTADRRAAAVHCRGEAVASGAGHGSLLVTAMSAQRAASVLGVRLRLG